MPPPFLFHVGAQHRPNINVSKGPFLMTLVIAINSSVGLTMSLSIGIFSNCLKSCWGCCLRAQHAPWAWEWEWAWDWTDGSWCWHDLVFATFALEFIPPFTLILLPLLILLFPVALDETATSELNDAPVSVNSITFVYDDVTGIAIF